MDAAIKALGSSGARFSVVGQLTHYQIFFGLSSVRWRDENC